MQWRSKSKTANPGGASNDGRLSSEQELGNLGLWDLAFSELRKEKLALVDLYEKILALKPEKESAATLSGQNAISTEVRMSELVSRKLESMNDRQWRLKLRGKSIKIRSQVERILKIVIVAKNLGSSLASLDPVHAGLPGAGICFLLPLLLNDSQQRSVTLDGLEYIAKLIRRFSGVEDLYLRHVEHRLNGDLEATLLKLYRQILEFEAKAVCSFDRNTALQTARNIAKADGWEESLSGIKESETACNILTRIIDAECQHKWNEHLEILISEQTQKVDQLLSLSLSHTLDNDEDIRLSVKRAATIEAQKGVPSEADKARCHALFRTTDYAFDKDMNPTRIQGTCEWFLRHPIYTAWFEKPYATWLWVTANPGCGKSVLARHLVDDFKAAQEEAYEERAIYLCYFFFKDDSEKNRSATHAMCALLHQLISQSHSMIEHAMAPYYANGQELPRLFETLWAIFVQCVENSPKLVVCVLDALDECAEASRSMLLQTFATYYSSHKDDAKLKTIIISRPETPISDAIWQHGVDPLSIKLSGEHETQLEAIGNEIDLFIANRIQHFRRLREHRKVYDDAHKAVNQKLISVENRTYLWVSLIFPELERHAGTSKGRLLAIVQKIPLTVQAAYENILQRSPNPSHARDLLHIVLAATRPLTLSEMNVALAVEHASDPIRDLEKDPEASFQITVQELCGLFVIIKDSQIYLIHQTAREFLIKMDEAQPDLAGGSSGWIWKRSFAMEDSHCLLTHICVLYLVYISFSKTLGPSFRIESELELYATKFWSIHFRNACLSKERLETEAIFPSIWDTVGVKYTWFQVYLQVSDWGLLSTKVNVLSTASMHGHSIIVQKLLGFFNVIDCIDIDGYTPLWYAIQNGRKETAHVLLNSMQDTPKNRLALCAALQVAADSGDEDIVRALLRYRAVDPSYADPLGRTALMFATRKGKGSVVSLLLEYLPNKPSSADALLTSLQLAAHRGHNDVVNLLIAHAAALNISDASMVIAQATHKGKADTVRCLISARHRLQLPEIALQMALQCALFQNDCSVAEVLLDGDIDLEARTPSGETALHLACGVRSDAFLIKLLKKGADVNAVADRGWHRSFDGVGETALYCATTTNDVDAVRILLQFGADPNVRCRNGATALFRAAAGGQKELVQLLLDFDADPRVANKRGDTPISIANDGIQSLLAEALTGSSFSLAEMNLQAPGREVKDNLGLARAVDTPSTTRSRDANAYHPLLKDAVESIDIDTFGQILEMDDNDDRDHEYHFSRSIMCRLQGPDPDFEFALVHDSLISGDFLHLYSEVGDHLKGIYSTTGLHKAVAICQEISNLTERKYFCIARTEDVEYVSADAVRLQKIKGLITDLQVELGKAVKILQDFCHELQTYEFEDEVVGNLPLERSFQLVRFLRSGESLLLT